jgi:succinate dehydrogenase/fumarate reductase-like Fe-S protein
MKTKKLSKKMRLNKKSIANLNSDMMGNVKGMSGTYCPTATYCASVCPTHCDTCVSLCDTGIENGRGMMKIC